MLVIGLTGSIGTGKSEVARLLQALGAVVINADQVGHEAYRPNSDSWREVVKVFGEEILQPSGEIDRRKLGAVVFSDPEQLAKLNNIMHPRMARMVAQQLESLRSQGTQVAVVRILDRGKRQVVLPHVFFQFAPHEAPSPPAGSPLRL